MNNVITNNNKQCTLALAALHQVTDPEIGLNIVDLGLINQIDFNEEDREVFVSMTLTTPFCPMGDSIRDGALRAIQQAFPTFSILVRLVFSPPWNSGRISEKGLEFLNR